MFSKTTLISTLLGAVALNLLGYAFYEYLAGSYFEAHHNISMEGNMDPIFITIGSVIFAYGMGLIMHGTTQWMDLQAQIVDSLWSFVYYGITGGIMGWTFKKLQPVVNA